MSYYRSLNKTERLLYWLALSVVFLGVLMRVVIWLQNRNLIIDESNIARNLYERDFAGLTKPLSYEQYAPIFFLWVEEFSTILFGFSEYALKIYPLLCGIGAMIMLFLLLREYVSLKNIWYPLAFFATAHFFIRYSTEVKQYMSDALVVLTLLYLALRMNIREMNGTRFFIFWALVGTFAIFSAMPSVFALAGVGSYYLWICIKAKRRDKLLPLILVSLVWLVEFALYYYFLLKDQAHSKYLQDFHANYFLVATPTTYKEFAHNWNVTTELISLTTGYTILSKLFNYSLLGLGCALLLYKNVAKGLLIVLPIFFTLVAAAINEYTMIPRVVLFMMPLFLVLIGYGLDFLTSKQNKAVRYTCWVLCIACLVIHTDVKRLWKPFYNEEITRAMQLMKDGGIRAGQINISHGSVPAYIYYTQIHPDKQRWILLNNATIRNWDADWAQIGKETGGRFGVIFTTIPTYEANQHKAEITQSARILSSIEDSTAKCYAFVFEK